MKDLVFAMELEGEAAPVEGRDGTMAAHTTGIGPNGESVVFKSEVVAGEGADDDAVVAAVGATDLDDPEAAAAAAVALEQAMAAAEAARATADTYADGDAYAAAAAEAAAEATAAAEEATAERIAADEYAAVAPDSPVQGVAPRAVAQDPESGSTTIQLSNGNAVGYVLSDDGVITLQSSAAADPTLAAAREAEARANLTATAADRAQAIADVRASIEERPEFMVKLMAIDGASDLLSSEIRTALRRTEHYLGLASFTTIILAGVAIALAAASFAAKRKNTVALLRTLGATRRYVLAYFSLEVLLLGIFTATLGAVLGAGCQEIIAELKNIDKVAFIRFASVYRDFKDLGEFQAQIEDLKS